MHTLSYEDYEWQRIWPKLAKDYTALSMGTALGFTLRRESIMIECQDAPVGVEKITIHLDFEDATKYTMFLLKYK